MDKGQTIKNLGAEQMADTWLANYAAQLYFIWLSSYCCSISS